MTTQNFDEIKPQLISHLQFLGYEVTEKESNRLFARHSSKFNFIVKSFRGGLLLTSFVGCEDAAKSDRAGYLEFINAANSEANLVRYFCDSDSDLVIEGWYCVGYDQVDFGRFMDSWDDDFDKLANRPETETYLK